ncbi:histidine kinase-like ATPase domain-containing protein [Aspergillus undulatus]|uniref:histidine kinase-like ATPase domain-containing protein n=1 Tax=Aspergillus undulatus TaxID=1810928 RepID=UPI003CCCD973
MVQKIDFSALKARTMGSGADEEAVTVDTRGLISKVLARYSGRWTVLREMIQNAADANATKVTIKFETLPSTTVPLPSSPDDTTAMIKHTISHHTLKRLLISNNGLPFSEKDWARLKRIADGNPDETKIGAFGVGFYSVFDDCEEPFVSSGTDAMAFYWKGNALFTRRLQLGEKTNPETTFVLDYRNDTSPVPSLMQLCQFLSSSLTFVNLECIELWLDDWDVLRLAKKAAPSTTLAIPRDIETKTQDGLMKVTSVTREVAQVDAVWMRAVEWNPNASIFREGIRDTTTSLRSFLSRLTQTSSEKPIESEKKEATSQSGDLAKTSTASVFLHINTASIQASISQSLSSELERATRKPPPKKTSIAVLTPSYDTSQASAASGSQSEFLSSILPSKGGRVFIGFPTQQTTGLNAHISAPSVIPTVERESIDLNTRYISKWNMEMLRAAGIVCRIAWAAEMATIQCRIQSAKDPSKQSKIRKEDIVNVLPEAIHTANQFVFRESTPSSLLGQTMEDAFWTCNKNASIEVLSTCGVAQNHRVRVAAKDLTFIDSIPVLPDEFVEGSKEFVKKLTMLGLVTEVTVSDIKRELETSPLRASQITEFLNWLGRRAISGQLDLYSVKSILNVAVASTDDENGNATGLIVFSEVSLFLNPQRIPADLPLPPTVMPFKYTKSLAKRELDSFDWQELQIVPWLSWLVSNSGNRNVLPLTQDITQTSTFAAQVLPVISKQWESLGQSSKQDVINQLQVHTIIPTRVGMKRPSETYFPSVRLFDDLPVIHGLQGVKEKFLAALGVRKTVELGVIFERLLNAPAASDEKSSSQGKWSHVDLIRYLASVSNDIPASDIKRLKDTSFCTAEPSTGREGSKTLDRKRYEVQDLFEPNDSLRALGLQVIEWPGNFISSSNEGRFLSRLGLRSCPTAIEVVRIMAKAAASNDRILHGKAMSYYVAEYESNGYGVFDCNSVTDPFLPIEKPSSLSAETPKDQQYSISGPGKCYTDDGAALFGFNILRKDLHRHASKLGVKQHPKLSDCLDTLIRRAPSTKREARLLFGYLAGRVSELTSRDIDRVGKAEIVPVHIDDKDSQIRSVRRVAPRLCYLGEGEDYKDLFDFVDFGQEANLFLMAVGSKREPTKIELAQMVVREPARISSTLQSAERYLKLLRTLAEDMAVLKKNKELFREMRKSAFLLASREITLTTEQTRKEVKKSVEISDDEDEAEEEGIKEWTLTSADNTIVVDDYQSFVQFKDHVLAAPQEEVLENFYIALGAVPLSRIVEERAHWGALAPDQRPAIKLLKLIKERSRLFLHDQPPEGIRHDSRWLDQNLKVEVVQSIAIARFLRDRRISYRQERKAIVTEVQGEHVMRICPGRYDFYEISQALSLLIFNRPKLHSSLTLEMLLKTDLLELKGRGYNVERILKQKAQEARIAEDRRQKQVEEERRLLQEKEAALQKEAQNLAPEKQGPGPMPGVFPDSPSSKRPRPGSPSETTTETTKEKRNGLFSNFTKHFKDGNRSSWNPFSDTQTPSAPETPKELPPAPQPEKPKEPCPAAPVTVSSPLKLQKELHSAVQSSRVHGTSNVSSKPQTDQINELKSYCDEKPGHELEFVATLPSQVNILFAKSVTDRSAFLSQNSYGMNMFGSILLDCADVFSLRPDSLSIFHDPKSKSIAFNRTGSIFCNYHYFQNLHEKALLQSATPDRAEATVYWWVILCHELAHNLVSDHSSAHSYYTESFVSQYFPRVTAKLATTPAKSQS